MHLELVSLIYTHPKNYPPWTPMTPGKGLAVLTLLPPLLGCREEKTPMSY